jgi:hypothetical protein
VSTTADLTATTGIEVPTGLLIGGQWGPRPGSVASACGGPSA